MALEVGSRLAHYDVTALIGEGGMGQVYQATDTKLNRQVALKILPEAFASDPDRLARFQREAQVLASLNHPNIAQIHGLEEADDTRALVLELVEGPTLADRIKQGPIPVDEALPIAKQIAEALEAAHEAGVIHRDLKPANIKLKPDGTVKVLDFGLAKALDATPEGDPSQSPTLTAAATKAGVILGTAAYMSPEQATGKPVDKRADVWSFGAVLFEMVTGQRAFAGGDVTEVLASVLAREPDWALLPHTLSPVLGAYLRRCFHKDPKQRVPDIAAMRLAMEGAFESPSAASEAIAALTLKVWQRAATLLGIGLVVALVGSLAVWSTTRPEPPPLTRFEVTTPNDVGNQFGIGFALSPDGRTLVFIGTGPDGNRLYRRSLDEAQPVPIAATEEPYRPFFSPDGEWVGYFEGNIEGTLKKVRLDGTSSPAALAPVPGAWASAGWSEDNEIVFGSHLGLWRVAATGGDAKSIQLPDSDEAPRWLDLLPGGQAVLGTTGRLPDTEIVVVDLTTGKVTPLLAGASPRYVATGHLVFWRDYRLWAVTFDTERHVTLGSPVVVVESVAANTVANGLAMFTTGGGSLVHDTTGREATDRSLVWVSRDGNEQPIEAEADLYLQPRLSPDGNRIAIEIADEEHDIHILDLQERRWTRLTLHLARDTNPVWTLTGDRILFTSHREGSGSLFSKAADSTGQSQRILEAPADHQFLPYAWSDSGRRLVINEQGDGNADVGVVSMDPEPALEPLLAEPFAEVEPSLSPDGRWIVYRSLEPGFSGIVVRPFPDVENGKWLISSEAFVEDPLWSPNGGEIFYISSGRMMSVRVRTQPAFSHDDPEPLFQGRYLCCIGVPYDVAADGRFLMLKRGGLFAPMIFVENWTEELKRVVPTN